MASLQENNSIIPAHQYPAWVISFAVVVMITMAYAIVLLPKYISASQKLHSANIARDGRNFTEATKLYNEVILAVPNSQRARISAAEVIFSNDNKNDDSQGLELLSGIKLIGSDMDRINKVMPQNYQQY
jgi:hypothetical protein